MSYKDPLTFLPSISRFAKSVTKSTTRIETLLKVIIPPEVSEMRAYRADVDTTGPQDPAEGFIMNYALLIGDASFSNFQKVRTLIGRHSQRVHGALRSVSFLVVSSIYAHLLILPIVLPIGAGSERDP